MSLDLSPEEFKRLAQGVVEIAARYLEQLDTRPIAPGASGAETRRLFGQPEAPEQGVGERVLELLQTVVEQSRSQNGRFLGYVLGSGEPAGAVADLLASVLNQNVTAWRSGPAAVEIERAVVGWLARGLGCLGFHGSLTGGGSSANLMGLALAREAVLPANEAGARPGMVYASREVHMSIPKAVALLGIGRSHLRLLDTDRDLRLSPEALSLAVEEDLRDGRRPLAVVASAGTVSTGAVDPIEAIAAVARRYGLWLHVDGAYGALAALADPALVPGLSFADSLSVDAHKWLYQPLDCGALLFKDAELARRAFSHTGAYAQSLTDDPIEGFAFFDSTIELSRRFRALRLWTSIQYHGLAAMRAAIRNDLAHAAQLADLVRRAPELELLAPVPLSAVCFRHRFAQDPDPRNAALLARVNRRGRVYLSNAVVRGAFALRACFVNHRTRDEDVAAVVEEVLAAGREG